MNSKIYWTVLGGVLILNMLGFLMDAAWIRGTGSPGYFYYDIKYSGRIPFWLLADIVFIAVSLTVYFFFTGARLHIIPGHVNNYGRLPVKLMGVYLILIPAVLASFLLVSPDELTHGKLMDSLLNKRVIYLDGRITDDEADRIGKAVMLLNARDESRKITLYINSNGGSVMAGLNIYDAIKQSKAPVTGIVSNKAVSMAVIVLQACRTRKAYKHSHILIHNIEITNAWHKFEENLKGELEDVKYVQQNLDRLIAERSGLPVERVQDLSRNETLMKADEAKKLGLIDEVI
jgi:ATP-dependent Clp protease protease subunit